METETHKVKSGASNTTASIPIEFSVYSGVAGEKSEAEPVRDRWIYVFKKKSWGTQISAEIHVDDSGNLNLVNWKGESWPDTDDRPADVGRDVFEVGYHPDQYSVFFFLSRIQLSRERIREYVGESNAEASGLEAIAQRGMLFDPQTSDYVEPLGDDQPGCRVYLTDYVQVAQQLHGRYEEALDRFGSFIGDEKKTTRNTLATLTKSVAEKVGEKNEDVWSWFDRDQLEQDINNYERQRQSRKTRVDQWGQELCDWMRLPAFQEMLFDYTGTSALKDKGHDLQADLYAGLSQCEPGRTFLRNEVWREKHWYRKIAFPDSGQASSSKGYSVGSNEKAFTFLHELGVTLADWKISEAASLVQSFFQRRFDRSIQFFKTHQEADGGLSTRKKATFDEVRKGDGLTKGIYLGDPDPSADDGTQRLNFAFQQSRRTGGLPKVGSDRVLAILNLINLAMAQKSAATAKGTEKQALATASLVSAIADVTDSVADFLNSAKANTIGNVASIVGGAIGYGTSVYKLATRSSDMNNGVVVGLSFAALGGAFGAASGVAGSGTVFLGLLSSTGVGAVGVGLAMLGAGIVYYFKESPLEKWYQQSPWGTNPASRPARAHLDELFEILAGFAVECDVLRIQKAQVEAVGSDPFFEWKTDEFDYVLRFRIFPGLYYPQRSLFEIKKVTIGGNEIGAFSVGRNRVQQARQRGRFTFQDESVLEVKPASGQVEEITRLWGLEGYPTGTPDYEYTVILDVLRNGEYTIEVEGSGSTMPVHDVDGNTVETLK